MPETGTREPGPPRHRDSPRPGDQAVGGQTASHRLSVAVDLLHHRPQRVQHVVAGDDQDPPTTRQYPNGGRLHLLVGHEDDGADSVAVDVDPWARAGALHEIRLPGEPERDDRYPCPGVVGASDQDGHRASEASSLSFVDVFNGLHRACNPMIRRVRISPSSSEFGDLRGAIDRIWSAIAELHGPGPWIIQIG